METFEPGNLTLSQHEARMRAASVIDARLHRAANKGINVMLETNYHGRKLNEESVLLVTSSDHSQSLNTACYKWISTKMKSRIFLTNKKVTGEDDDNENFTERLYRSRQEVSNRKVSSSRN